MAFMAQEQFATIPVVAQQSALMTQRFRDWPDAYLARQTCCSGWTAGDIVAHLATGADFYTEVISAGLQGRPGLPWQAVALDEVRDIRAAAVARLQRGGPAALIDGFAQAAANLQGVFASLQVNDLAKMAWHPRGLIPIGCWIGMRLTELVVHDWDILQPHDVGLQLSPIATPALLTSLPEMQQRFLEQRLLVEECDGVYALHAGEQSWAFVRQGQEITYQSTIPEYVTTHLYTDMETMILLTLGRADFKAQLQDGVCTLTGDVALAHIFYAALFMPYLSSSAIPPRVT
jgi:uncharacterized protein (TIGR03083 family)